MENAEMEESELYKDFHWVAECIARWVCYLLQEREEGRRHFPDMFGKILTPNIGELNAVYRRQAMNRTDQRAVVCFENQCEPPSTGSPVQ